MNPLLNNIKSLIRENTKNINFKNKENSTFKENYDFKKRKNESELIMAKYPNKIPIVCERYDKTLPHLDRKKYLVPEDLIMSNFLYVIRKRLKLDAHKSLYIAINNKIPPLSQNVSTIYDKFCDEDGFLYIKYCEETTFGL
jgi:GABA(A) receptor-associated protein